MLGSIKSSRRGFFSFFNKEDFLDVDSLISINFNFRESVPLLNLIIKNRTEIIEEPTDLVGEKKLDVFLVGKYIMTSFHFMHIGLGLTN